MPPKSSNGNDITSTNHINVVLRYVEETDRTWVDKDILGISQRLRRITRIQFIKHIIRSSIQNQINS